MPDVKSRGHLALSTDLEIQISNLDDLFAAYGSNFCLFAVSSVYERLTDCGISAHALRSMDATILVDLMAASRSSAFFQRQVTHALSPEGEDRLLPFIQAAVGRDPVEHDGVCAYLRIQVRYLGRVETAADPKPREGIPTSADGWQRPAIPPWRDARCQAFRADMALACRLLDDLRAGRLALAFQPISMFDSAERHGRPYSEALLHNISGEGGEISGESGERAAYVLPDAIAALERLGIVIQLDHSVIWTLIRLLESHPCQRLGCNVSARSLRKDSWWNALLDYLDASRSVAERLTLEITETFPIVHVQEALSLISELQRRGVRIALDDMGAGWSSLDFLAEAKADVVKIDRSVLLRSCDARESPDPLCDLVRICADHGSCVIVEGVETDAERFAAHRAGAHGIQGIFIEAPTVRPAWLDTALVRVADTCVQVPGADEREPASDAAFASRWSRCLD